MTLADRLERGRPRAGPGRPVGRAIGRSLRELVSGRGVVIGIAVLVVGWLAAVPLFYLVHDTFTGPTGFTLDAFRRAYGGQSQAVEMVRNSLVFSAGSAALALLGGSSLAYLHARTDAPLRPVFFAASLVPLVIPSVLYAAAWIFLADPGIGVLNAALPGDLAVNVYSMPGLIWVEGLHLTPIAFLMMVAAFRNVDPSLEESALLCGARWPAVLRRVTLPVLRPALLSAALLMFVEALQSFEVPGLLGLQNGIWVFTNRIYYVLRGYPIDFGVAGAYALGLLAVAGCGVALTAWLSRQARRHQSVTGKAFRARRLPLGRARPLVGVLVALYFLVTAVLPLAVLVYASFLPYYQLPSMAAVRSMSADSYREVAQLRSAGTALANSVLLGLGAATVVMALTAVLSWLVVRTRMPGRRLLDLLAFSPLVVPGLVLGLALSFVYLRTSVPIYGTLWILLIAYCTRFLPFGMRYASAAMVQTSQELEESAAACGASWWASFRRVLLPLAARGLLAGWIYIVIVSFRELSSSILLYSPGKEVLAVLIWEQLENGRFTVVAAIGVCMVLILLVLVLLAHRLGARVGLEEDQR